MKRFLLLLVVFALSISPVLSQQVIFSEDFETGTPSTDWGLYWDGEEPILAMSMASAPAVLPNGGNFVGLVQDIDGSNTGASLALAGAVDARDYTIEADVYCYENHAGGSAYTGLAFYADSSHQGTQSHGIYIKFVADFDADNRFRLYNNQLSMTTFQYTFHEAIDATGLHSGDAWHHMKVDVETIGDSLTVMSCYFDGSLLGQYIDNGVDQFDQGRFGLFAFQQGAAGIAGYFDNIVVTENPTGISDESELLLPENPSLAQNFPNPFNPNTNIEFALSKSEFVKLSVYNTAGKLIKTLTEKQYSTGTHHIKWDATDISGNKVSAGVYLYSLQTTNKVETKKMILLK